MAALIWRAMSPPPPPRPPPSNQPRIQRALAAHVLLAIKPSCFLLRITLKNTLPLLGTVTPPHLLARPTSATFYPTAADKTLSPCTLIPRLSGFVARSGGESSALASCAASSHRTCRLFSPLSPEENYHFSMRRKYLACAR